MNKKIQELKQLCDIYPTKIPLSEVAKFLSMNVEGLKSALYRHQAPFGFAYDYQDGGNRVAIIPTITFYLWITNGGLKDDFSGT